MGELAECAPHEPEEVLYGGVLGGPADESDVEGVEGREAADLVVVGRKNAVVEGEEEEQCNVLCGQILCGLYLFCTLETGGVDKLGCLYSGLFKCGDDIDVLGLLGEYGLHVFYFIFSLVVGGDGWGSYAFLCFLLI